MSFRERADDSVSISVSLSTSSSIHRHQPSYKTGSLPPVPSIRVHSPPADGTYYHTARRTRATEPAVPFPRIDFGGDIDISLSSSLPKLNTIGLPSIAQKDEPVSSSDMLSLRQRLDAMSSGQERARLHSDSTITSSSTRKQPLSPKTSWSTFGKGSRL